MPRHDAHLYRTVGCELTRTEVNVLESRARSEGKTTGEVVRTLVREYLSKTNGVSATIPVPSQPPKVDVPEFLARLPEDLRSDFQQILESKAVQK